MKSIITYSIMAIILISGISLMAYQRLNPPEITKTPTPLPTLPTSTLETVLSLPEIPSPNPATSTPGTETVSVAEVVSNAGRYDNQSICIRGSYQNSFEFSAFGGSFDDANNLMKPWIWVEATVEKNQLQCVQTAVGQTICRGTTTACGKFHYAAPGEDGLGHTQAYRYKLD